MSNSKQTPWIVFGLLIAVLVGGGFFVIPTYRCASQTKARTDNLRQKIAGLSGQTEVVQRLADEVTAMRRHLNNELKTIPTTPNVAELMKKLSLPVDGVTVSDQTFTAGAAGDAVTGRETGAMAMPLTIEMVARFDSVFATIRAAESLPRLLRVASVRLEVDRERDLRDEPLLTASVGIESVYKLAEGKERR